MKTEVGKVTFSSSSWSSDLETANDISMTVMNIVIVSPRSLETSVREFFEMQTRAHSDLRLNKFLKYS